MLVLHEAIFLATLLTTLEKEICVTSAVELGFTFVTIATCNMSPATCNGFLFPTLREHCSVSQEKQGLEEYSDNT